MRLCWLLPIEEILWHPHMFRPFTIVWNKCADCGVHKCIRCWPDHSCRLVEADADWLLHSGIRTSEGMETHYLGRCRRC